MVNSFPLLAIPWFIQHEVFRYMDPVSRFSIRQCSKRMRRIVNECEPCYKRINLYVYRNTGEMTLYTDSDQETVVKYRREAAENEENCVSGEDYIQRIAIDFSGIVANPRVTVGYLDVVGLMNDDDFEAHPDKKIRRDVGVLMQCIGEQMSVLGEQMKLECLGTSVEVPQSKIMALLPVIKAGFLRKMELELIEGQYLNRVTATEQWNRAREVHLEYTDNPLRRLPSSYDRHKVPIERLLHFPAVIISSRSLTIGEAEKIVEAAIRQGDEFIRFQIYTCYMTRANQDLIQQLINRQNPDCQLEFEIDELWFSVDRKRKVGN